MLSTFSVLKDTIKLKVTPVSIDNLIFKLHYRVTVIIFLIATLLVTSRQYIGEHIKCIIGSDDKNPMVKVVNTFCFFTSTYTVVKHMNETSLASGIIAHPGVGPIATFSDEPIIRHAYYQWVPFVLFLQAICFYVPHLIWKKKEGGRVKMLVVGLQLASMALHDRSYALKGRTIPSKAEKENTFNNIKKEFINRVHNAPWSYWLITCEVMNLVNLLLNIYLTNRFLGGHFYRLGPTVCTQGLESEVDILDEIFPKVTKCDFYKYGPSGSLQKHDAMCVMALNIVNDKIYVFLWFWFVFLAFATVAGLLWRAITVVLHSRSSRFNSFVFSSACPGKLNPWNVATVTREAHFADWLFLYYLAKSMDGYVFKEFFVSLANELDERDTLLTQPLGIDDVDRPKSA